MKTQTEIYLKEKNNSIRSKLIRKIVKYKFKNSVFSQFDDTVNELMQMFDDLLNFKVTLVSKEYSNNRISVCLSYIDVENDNVIKVIDATLEHGNNTNPK